MPRIQNPNIDILMQAVDKLGPLVDEMVFLGGCATGLLITDTGAPPLRVTRDVDAIVQVLSVVDYYQFSDRLRAQGFKEDSSEDAPICRWLSGHIILDVMPTDTKILGFGNQWYDPAAKHAMPVTLPSGKTINMVSAAYFLVTKLEAFEGRGAGDFLASHDIEDIVAVLDGRKEIIEEVKLEEPELIHELSKRFNALLREQRFIDAVSGHMPVDETSQARIAIVLNRMQELARL